MIGILKCIGEAICGSEDYDSVVVNGRINGSNPIEGFYLWVNFRVKALKHRVMASSAFLTVLCLA